MGPNGPAMETSFYDYENIIKKPEYKQYYSALVLLGYTGSASYINQGVVNIIPEKTRNKTLKTVQTPDTLRRLTFIPDKEGKTRGIAVFDYLTQCVLKPIHDNQASILARIPNDYTFNQNGYKEKINSYFKMDYSKRPTCYSIDLKSATDRFPIYVQYLLVSILYQDTDIGKS